MFVLLCLFVCFRSVGAGMCRRSGLLRLAAGLKKFLFLEIHKMGPSEGKSTLPQTHSFVYSGLPLLPESLISK